MGEVINLVIQGDDNWMLSRSDSSKNVNKKRHLKISEGDLDW